MLTQASTEDSYEALLRLFTSEDPLESVESQMQNFKFESDIIHPVAYIPGSISQSQCRWPVIMKGCFSVFVSVRVFLLLAKCQPNSTFKSETTTQNFHRKYQQ